MTPFTFLIACFATSRISLLFTKDHARHSATHEWLSCIFCFSMTGSAFVCGMLWLAGTRQHWAEWFMTWCALSAVTILLNQKFTKGEL
jgi:hypothetical protein